MSALQRAIKIATEAHKGQFDKTGNDYLMHMTHGRNRLTVNSYSYGNMANQSTRLPNISEESQVQSLCE